MTAYLLLATSPYASGSEQALCLVLLIVVVIGGLIAGVSRNAEKEKRHAEIADNVRAGIVHLVSYYENHLLSVRRDAAQLLGLPISDDGDIHASITLTVNTPAEIQPTIEKMKAFKLGLRQLRQCLNAEKASVKQRFNALMPELPALGTGQWGVKAERAELGRYRTHLRVAADTVIGHIDQLKEQFEVLITQISDFENRAKKMNASAVSKKIKSKRPVLPSSSRTPIKLPAEHYYLCVRPGEYVGPHGIDAIREWVSDGIISPDWQVCLTGDKTWVSIKDIPGFYDFPAEVRTKIAALQERSHTRGWTGPATEKQITKLRFFDIPFDVDNLTKGRASELISAFISIDPDCEEQYQNRPALPDQVEQIVSLGGNADDLTYEEARDLIEDIGLDERA